MNGGGGAIIPAVELQHVTGATAVPHNGQTGFRLFPWAVLTPTTKHHIGESISHACFSVTLASLHLGCFAWAQQLHLPPPS